MKEIALVTGASRGIGKAIALELAENGYDIWLNYASNDEAAIEAKAAVESTGRSCQLLKFDVSNKSEIESILIPEIKKLNRDDERVCVLVNNAGITRDNFFYWFKDEDWNDVINTNLNSLFYVSKPVIEHMFLNKKGYIVNISSIAGEVGNPGQANYSAAKGGLISATKSMARELARVNILVNCVSPGLIETDMTDNLKLKKDLLKRIPLKRYGDPKEVAQVVSFLCSPKASYIVGSVIPVNGGFA